MAAPAPEDPAHRAKSVADELPLLVAHGTSDAATEGERALAAAERLESLDVPDTARGVAGGSWSERTSPTGYYCGPRVTTAARATTAPCSPSSTRWGAP